MVSQEGREELTAQIMLPRAPKINADISTVFATGRGDLFIHDACCGTKGDTDTESHKHSRPCWRLTAKFSRNLALSLASTSSAVIPYWSPRIALTWWLPVRTTEEASGGRGSPKLRTKSMYSMCPLWRWSRDMSSSYWSSVSNMPRLAKICTTEIWWKWSQKHF